MATHKSAVKRHKQSLKRRERNRVAKATIRTTIKKVRALAESGNLSEANKLFVKANSLLDSAASKGIIHKANAQRNISRLSQYVASVKSA
ncbi:MAG: 30S ribosomal protein S20 [Deltaproteobacteria bacterium]|nr:30S ribosomal protein S20 [Deltaproteobacteria bacterium]